MDETMNSKENKEAPLKTAYTGHANLGLQDVTMIVTERLKDKEKDTRIVEFYRETPNGQITYVGRGEIQKYVEKKSVPVEQTVDELED